MSRFSHGTVAAVWQRRCSCVAMKAVRRIPCQAADSGRATLNFAALLPLIDTAVVDAAARTRLILPEQGNR